MKMMKMIKMMKMKMKMMKMKMIKMMKMMKMSMMMMKKICVDDASPSGGCPPHKFIRNPMLSNLPRKRR